MIKYDNEIKNSLFKRYFGKKERLIKAYNAIAGSDLPITAKINITTHEKNLYFSESDYITFTLNDRFIVLINNRTIINEDIPTKLLIFIADIYKNIIIGSYSNMIKTKSLPAPEFFVIYTGREKYPDKKVLRLSDAFNTNAVRLNLDLFVTVYNITKGHNVELLSQCSVLSDYAVLVSLVYEGIDEGKTHGADI